MLWPILSDARGADIPLPGLASTSILLVDINAPGQYVADGTAGRPFKSVQAAINAAAPNTTIFIKPGAYSENIVMRDLDSVSIQGSAEQNTIITNAAPGHTFSWVPDATAGAAVNSFAMSGLTVVNTDTTGTYHAMHLDANAVVYPNTFLGDEADFNFVDVDGMGGAGKTAAFFRNVGMVFWTHGQVDGGDLYVTNCSQFAARQLEVGTLTAPTNFVAEYNGNNPRNGLGRSNVTLAEQSIIYGDLQLKGHPIWQEDTTCLVVGNVTGTLTSFYAAGRDYCPTLLFYGQHGLLGMAGGSAPQPCKGGARQGSIPGGRGLARPGDQQADLAGD